MSLYWKTLHRVKDDHYLIVHEAFSGLLKVATVYEHCDSFGFIEITSRFISPTFDFRANRLPDAKKIVEKRWNAWVRRAALTEAA